MDFALNDGQREWQMKARKFAEEEVRPLALQWDQIPDPRKTFDWEIIKKGSRLGFRTLATPKEWGGHGADLVTQSIVMAEIARADISVAKTFSQNWKWSHLIMAACTREQQERFLKPFVEDDTYLLGSGGTEPNAGSDNRLPPDDDPKAGYKLRAERRGNEWILNGEKCFIANGGVAKLFFVNTRTNPNVSITDGGTVFLVRSDTPGFRIGKVFNKRGWRFYQNAELVFEDARVPHANVIGEVNRGQAARRLDVSQFGEIELAANALGVCDAAVEMAVHYSGARTEQGKALSRHQTVQLRLSEMRILTEALRSLTLRTAWERDLATQGAKGHINAQFAAIFSKTTVQRVTQLNVEIHRMIGAMDAGAEKLLRDAAIWTHLAGDIALQIKSVKDWLK